MRHGREQKAKKKQLFIISLAGNWCSVSCLLTDLQDDLTHSNPELPGTTDVVMYYSLLNENRRCWPLPGDKSV